MRLIRIAGGILLCILALIAAYTRRHSFDGLLLAVPKQGSGGGINVELLEDVEVLLTYEVRSSVMVRAINKSLSVGLIQTNHSYPFLMGYNIISGGFFTRDAEDGKQKAVCMNRKAAFETFGDMDIIGREVLINGEKYYAAGVIDDEDTDNPNVYMPLIDGKLETMLIYTENKDYTANKLSNAGVSGYSFIELNSLSNAVVEKTEAAFSIYIIIFTIIMIRKRFFTIPAVFGLFAWVFTRHTGTFMNWNINMPMLWAYSNDSFADKIELLKNVELYSNIFLAVFAVVMVATMFTGYSQD